MMGWSSKCYITKFCGNRLTSSGEDFWPVFTIYWHGGHFGSVTSIMLTDFHFLVPETFHTKFGSDRQNSFYENSVQLFVCTRPWAKVKK